MKDEANIYQDAPSYPDRDARELNVVERIKEVSTRQYTRVEDDSTEESELKRAINQIGAGLNNTSSTLSTMSREIGTVPIGHTVCGDIAEINQNISSLSQGIAAIMQRLENTPKILKSSDIEDIYPTTPMTTAEVYTALKENMSKGDIFISELNISDGPSGLSAAGLEHLGIFAYAVVDTVYDGEVGPYARVYMIATTKTSSDMWSCSLIGDTYTWIQINA